MRSYAKPIKKGRFVTIMGKTCFEVPLTKGMVAIVDSEDAEKVSQLNWHAVNTTNKGTYYAANHPCKKDGIRASRIWMHRFLLGITKNQTDHINGNGLDNRRSNLRPATQTENQKNRSKSLGKTSKYIGVSLGYKGRWRAALQHGKSKHIGMFDTEEAAAMARDREAAKISPFYRLNFPI